MSRRIFTFVAVSAPLAVIVACTGGVGALPGYDDSYDPIVGSRENPGAGREIPTNSTDPATGNGDRPPGSGGGGGGGADSSFDCSGTFVCTITLNGKTSTGETKLKNDNGRCLFNDDDDSTTFSDDGSIVSNGRRVGSWSASGDTIRFSASANGQSVSAVCTRKSGGGTNSPDPKDDDDNSGSGSGGAATDASVNR